MQFIIHKATRFYSKMCSSVQIKSFIFLDLETTGLPHLENNRTKITELCMIGIQTDHLRLGVVPRVQQKLTLCFNPWKRISDKSEEITGLSNFLLEALSDFSADTVNAMNIFLKSMPQPVCFVAHNGDRFDYPILRAHIDKTTVPLLDILCMDSLPAFRELLAEQQRTEESMSIKTPVNNNLEVLDTVKFESTGNAGASGSKTEIKSKDLTDFSDKSIPLEFTKDFDELLCNLADEAEASEKSRISEIQKINERTPEKQKIGTASSVNEHFQPNKKTKTTNVKRNLYFQKGYKLHEVYSKLTKKEPVESHRAEADVVMLVGCAAALGDRFVNWAKSNAKKFSDISPMCSYKKIGT